MARRHDSTVLFDQRDIAGAVRRHVWLVVLLAVVAAGGLAAYAHSKPVRYNATAQVITAQPISTTLLTNGNTPNVDPKVLQATQVAIITSDQIKDEVEKQYGPNLDVSVSAVSGSQLVAISATAASAVRAAGIANAYATADVSYSVNQQKTQIVALQDSITASVAAANARVAQLDVALEASPLATRATVQRSQTTERASVAQMISQDDTLLVSLQNDLVANSGPVSQATTASDASSAVGSGLLKLTILGFLLGAIVGVAGCVVFDSRDDAIHSLNALDAQGVNLWGTPGASWHPHRERGWWYAVDAPWSPLSEQWRLVTERAYLAAGGSRVILVTSVDVFGDPVAASLQMGALLAERGLTVAVLESDVADGRLAIGLGLPPGGSGLASRLSDAAPVFTDLVQVSAVSGLRVLPVGATESAGVLSGDLLARYVHGLSASVDVVVVAGPPVDHYSVTAPLARMAGATVLLVAENQTTVSTLDDARAALHDFGTTTGVVWVAKEDILWGGDYMGVTSKGQIPGNVSPAAPPATDRTWHAAAPIDAGAGHS